MTIVYVIFVLLCLYYSFRYDSTEIDDPKKNHRFWMMCVYLILVAGFRYGIGGDTLQYMTDFKYAYRGELEHIGRTMRRSLVGNNYMPLWVIVNDVLKHFTDSFYVFQFVQATVVNIAICHIARKYTHRQFLFLLLYFVSANFFMFNTEVMREGYAIAFALLGIECLMNRHYGWSLILIAIGILFHISALICLLFLFTKVPVPITKRTLWICLGISFGVWFISSVLIRFVIPMLDMLPESLSARMMQYSLVASTFFGWARNVFTYLFLPYIVFYYGIKWEEDPVRKDRKIRMTRWMLALGIIASSLAGFIRFGNYMQVYYMIMLADFVFLLFRKREHLLIRIGTTAGIAMMIGWLYLAYWPATNGYLYEFYYPYTCIVNEDYNLLHRVCTHKVAVDYSRHTDKKAVRDID